MSNSQRPLRDYLRNGDCDLCPLHQTAQHVCLIGDGKWPADIMLVGEAPGEREDVEAHKPFAGRAGKLLDSILETFELPRNSIFITNAVHCRPPGNAKPTLTQIRDCSQKYLRLEILKVKPKIIVAMGAIAAQAVLQSPVRIAIHSSRNKKWYTEKPFLSDIPVIVTYHPAAALRTDYLTERIVEDFETMFRVLRRGFPKDPKLNYQIVESVSEIKIPKKVKKVSVDLETDGLDPFLPKRDIISIQLSFKEGTGYYIRWNKRVAEEVKTLLENPRIVKVGHNLNKFDRKWLKQKAGITLRGPVRDTLIQVHLVDENRLDKSLDSVASDWTPLKGHKDTMQEYVRRTGCSWRDVPLDIASDYGCGDVDASLRLERIFTPRIKEEGMWPLFLSDMQVMKMLAEVETNGFMIDVDLIDDMGDHYTDRLKRLEDRLSELARRELNARSSQQVSALLYREWDLPAMGKPQRWNDPPTRDTSEDTLLKLIAHGGLNVRQKKVIRYVLRVREVSKLLSTYILGLGDFIRKGNLIHPSFKLHGAVTGRLSSSDPNFQNIPREGDIKRLFISRFGERGRLVQVDVSQAELRWAAQISGEPTLVSYFRAGVVDIHRKVAATVFKIGEDKVTKQQRKKAKTVNFGVLYGSGVYTMAEKMGCPVEEAKEFVSDWNEEFSGWDPFVREVEREVIRNGKIVSPFGRVRHLPILDPYSKSGRDALRQGLNSPIQGSASDFTKICGLNMRRRFRKEKIAPALFVNEVHDCWVIDTVDELVPRIAEVAREEFRNPDLKNFGIKLRVPMDVEISVGRNWKELEVLEG